MPQPFSSGGYETLISQISSATTATEVFDQWKTNKNLFRNEHVILALRMLGRYSKLLGPELQHSEENKLAYSQLSQKLESAVGEISEFGTHQLYIVDLIDVLFWLRKARQNKIVG